MLSFEYKPESQLKAQYLQVKHKSPSQVWKPVN